MLYLCGVDNLILTVLMTENLKDMSLTVCVCVSNCMSLSFTRGALSKCSHLTGIKWTEASADDEGMLDIISYSYTLNYAAV